MGQKKKLGLAKILSVPPSRFKSAPGAELTREGAEKLTVCSDADYAPFNSAIWDESIE